MNEKIKQMVELMNRTDKMRFLLKSNLFELNTLIEMNKEELDNLVMIGLEATGFKFKEEQK